MRLPVAVRRLRRGASTAGLAVLLAGCSLLGGSASVPDSDAPEDRYFQLQFAGAGGVVPVQVVDVTESLVGVEVDVRNPPAGGFDETFLAAVPGRPNAVLVGWLGGSCDERADIALELGVAGPAFHLKQLDKPPPCRLVAIPRRVIVTFDRPVNASDFPLSVTH